MKHLIKLAAKTALALSLSLMLFAPLSTKGMDGNLNPSKDCCFMEKGAMMCSIGGIVTRMDTNMTMKNGTRCQVNGQCILTDGKSIQLKDGQCCDMLGMVDDCVTTMAIKRKTKTTTRHKAFKKTTYSTPYFCPIHRDVTSGEEGHCGRCGMALVEKLPMEATTVDVD